ncbi:hypothetical protein PAPHI01_2462 [Pancytospora philotis]|nr:hypothetical protein PAPHI01_2462 [Pancytospora philotis]
MREHGYANYVRALKPRLTTRHKRARLGFARATIGHSDRAWERVVFTDEYKFTVYGHGGPRTVWRRRGPPTEPHHFRPVPHFGGGSVMVWGAITSRGVGELVVIPTTMTAAVFIDTLQVGLDATRRKYSLFEKECITRLIARRRVRVSDTHLIYT